MHFYSANIFTRIVLARKSHKVYSRKKYFLSHTHETFRLDEMETREPRISDGRGELEIRVQYLQSRQIIFNVIRFEINLIKF